MRSFIYSAFLHLCTFTTIQNLRSIFLLVTFAECGTACDTSSVENVFASVSRLLKYDHKRYPRPLDERNVCIVLHLLGR